jgi:pimeloyl-ACP methyl ester carboxylesterase
MMRLNNGKEGHMATYILVGGAWIGAWAWKSVAKGLRARGHDVYPLSLTGLGERAHLAYPDVDLETHIADVTGLIESEELANVILVGHSYAGAVVSGAANRAADKLGALVYLDSAPVYDGERFLDFAPAEAQEQAQRQVAEQGDGWRLPFPSLEELRASSSLSGLTDEHLSLMQRRAVGQPYKTYTQPLHLNGSPQERYRHVIIACEEGQMLLGLDMPRFKALNEPPWQVMTIDTGHWPMLSDPEAVVDALDAVGTMVGRE